MSKYNVHGGHNSIVPGASKYLNEVTEDRKVKNKVISLLKAQGHTVYDCTDDSGKTQSKNLANIVAKCNKHSVDLDISIHLNAGGGTGVEVLYTSSSGKEWATKLSKAVSSALGLKNRGAKKRDNLYVLNHTKSTAVLIECCFVDNQTDKEKWSVDKCAKAIVETITGKSITSSNNTANTSSNTSTTSTSKTSSTSNTSNSSKNYLSQGDKGSDVKSLQQKLIKCGYSCGSTGADGIFGSDTKTAVRAFQKDHGLSVDGLAGEKTMAKLNSVYKEKTSVKSKAPTYVVGKTYTVQASDLIVRKTPGGAAVGYSGLTSDGKKHDKDKDGALDKGTVITCKAVKKINNDIYVKSPSGWVAGYHKGNIYLK